MFKRASLTTKGKEVLFLFSAAIICFLASIFRFVYTDTKVFLFLNWNLFLAFIPWVLSNIIILNPSIQRNKPLVFLLIISWLIFFPNAPYIFTDLFHLKSKAGMPVWFDLILILSFAWTGLLVGFISLWDIETIISNYIHKKIIPLLSGILLILASFGIYIGRYLRWNSWDIIHKPFELFYDINDRLINPFDHSRTWGMTLFTGLFLNMVYWSLKLIRQKK